MAEYSDDFNAYTASTQPTGWTSQWNTTGTIYKEADTTTGAAGDSILRFSTGTDGRQAFTLDSVDADANRDDVEILSKHRVSVYAAGRDFSHIFGRLSGGIATENAYFARVTDSDENDITIV